MNMTKQEWTAVGIDEENGCEEWWEALDAAYPAFAASLRKNRVAVIRSELWGPLASLPGFEDGPEFAPTPILDFGGEGEQWAETTGRRHNVFEELS
jgi:hypothetical protein